MGSEKKYKDKKKQEVKDHFRKPQESQNIGNSGDNQKRNVGKQKGQSGNGHEKSRGWSGLAKLNMVLLLAVIGLSARVLYLHADGDVSEQGLRRARSRVDADWHTLAAFSGQQAQLGWRWAAAHAGRLDAYLSDTQAPYWLPVKSAAGRAAAVAGHYASLAGERALAVGSQAAEHGWTAVAPYWNATRAAARPHWDAAVTAAGPLWEAAAARGTAVKAGVLETAARLRQHAAPALLEWTAGARRAAADSWTVARREAPVYTAKAWQAGAAAWEATCSAWQLVRTEAPVYAASASDSLSRLLASLTGQ